VIRITLRLRPGDRQLCSPPKTFYRHAEVVILECTGTRKEGKPPSPLSHEAQQKTVTERIEKKKYNPYLRRHTVHKEIK